MQDKRHYKLYKSGKQWVTVALTSVAVLARAAAMTVATPVNGQTAVHAA